RPKLRLASRAMDTALSHSWIELYRSSLSFGRIRRSGSLVVLAAAQQIFRKREKALYIALQLAAIHQGLLQFVGQIGRCQIETSPCPITKANQLLVRDIRKGNDAVMEAILGQPCAPILNLDVL